MHFLKTKGANPVSQKRQFKFARLTKIHVVSLRLELLLEASHIRPIPPNNSRSPTTRGHCKSRPFNVEELMSWNPQQNPYQPSSPFSQPGGPSLQSSRDKLKGPGIGLLVVGGLGLVGMGIYLVLTIVGMFIQPEVMAEGNKLQGPERIGYFAGVYGFLIALFLNVAFQIIVIVGGYKMIRGTSRGLCLTACIVSIIPCTSGCCIFGIPFGIWGLVVLSDENVKRSFR